MPRHEVQEGEYLSLIAMQYGLPWTKVWDDPQNQQLRDQRKSPNILYPGDVLFIPELEVRQEQGATEQRHRFRLLDSKQKIRLVIRDEFGQPASGVEYQLHLPSGKELKGKTGDDGLVKADVPADVQKVRLVIPAINANFDLMVGHLDPVSRIKGVQQRLMNLGFDPGPIDGIVGPKTRGALLRFQTWAEVEQTGVADAQTRQELEKAHEGMSRNTEAEDRQGTAVTPIDAGEQSPPEPPPPEVPPEVPPEAPAPEPFEASNQPPDPRAYYGYEGYES